MKKKDQGNLINLNLGSAEKWLLVSVEVCIFVYGRCWLPYLCVLLLCVTVM